MPVDSPKEEKASTMQTSHASRFIDFGNFISFDYPPHPEEEDAKRLTEDVLQMLMSRFVSTKEEKTKLLKTVQVRLHPDKKGGSNDAMKWFREWRQIHEEWFLKGPQSNSLVGEKQQPAG